jgi:GH15 family glucan-1,4-alpha-glucosidase
MRDIVMGNGAMMLNFDQDLNLRDLYWPYGGFENHGDANRSACGIYADQQLSWLFSPEWDKHLGYLPDTPITRIKAINHSLGLELEINDALHPSEDLYLKRIVIRNRREYPREVKLIFYQDFSIRGIEAGDSAVYDPKTGGVYQYKRGCYILANCMSSRGGVDEYSTGVKRYQGREGTFKDAEDGHLALNPIADGPVDSAIGVRVELAALGEDEVYYWLIASHGLQDLRAANKRFLERPPEAWLADMARHYRSWIIRSHREFRDLTSRQVELFKSSLFTIRSQIDRKGAVVASPDADTFLVARDHYMYLWPRDGAMVAHALDLAGYPEEARRIYSFCGSVISEEGYFLQRYNPDGTPGCTWHPMILEGREIPPIQEDETALTIWALGRHYELYRDEDLVMSLYERMIRPALRFMCGYLDAATGLVAPSWDLWEERRGIMSFTCGAVYGALKLGVSMAAAAGDQEMADRCRITAGLLQAAMIAHLYHPGLGRFVRGLFPDQEGKLVPDYTMDASMYGLFAFGALPADDPRIESTMKAIGTELWCKTEVGGVARYTGDYYHRVSDDVETVPGNPWIITTLWLADWHITRGTAEDITRARRLIDWTTRQAREGNLLPEQVHPYTGGPMSVCPLTWSHSTLVKVIMDYLIKMESVKLN